MFSLFALYEALSSGVNLTLNFKPDPPKILYTRKEAIAAKF